MYIVKLPSGEYINLAFVRRVQIESNEERSTAVIHWEGGGSQVYHRENAQYIIHELSKLVSLNRLRDEAIAAEISNIFNPADAKTT